MKYSPAAAAATAAAAANFAVLPASGKGKKVEVEERTDGRRDGRAEGGVRRGLLQIDKGK